MFEWKLRLYSHFANQCCLFQGYKIFYTLEADLPITLWQTYDVALPQADQRQATITNLQPNRTYSLCVLAYSNLGEGPISDLIQVMTRPGGITC